MSRRPGRGRPPLRFLRTFRKAVEREAWAEAAELAEATVAAKSGCAEAHFALALASIHLDDLAAALAAASRASEMAPGTADYDDLLAVIYGLAGDVNNALFYGKAAAEAPRLAHLAGLPPETFPTLAQVFLQISDQPLLHRGLAALGQAQWTVAERWLRQHLAFAPQSREAAVGLGVCLLAQGCPFAAVETLRAARHRLPDDAEIASLLGRALSQTGAFDLARACHNDAMRLAPADGDLAAVALLDMLRDPRCAGASVDAEYQSWCRRFSVDDHGESPSRSLSDRPLTIGYVIANAAGSPAASWLADILSHRSTREFAVVGFGFGALSDPINRPFQKCVDRWQDLAGADALTMATMVRGEAVDILVDLVGLEMPALHAAFASRMAPCQVSWIALPTAAAPAAVDFIMTDGVVDTEEVADTPTATARLVTLRLGSVLAAPPDIASIGTTGADQSEELLFVADVGLSELNTATAEWWSAILHGVPEAKLVLRDRGLTQSDALKQVIDLFGTFGVAHRIDLIAEPSPKAFFATGDVALLPYPLPQPASLVDALTAGIPIVCPSGDARPARAAASIVAHLGLAADTVASDRESYINLAKRWATESGARADFPNKIAEAAQRSGIWDPAARARDLEDAFSRMWAATTADDGVRPLSVVSA